MENSMLFFARGGVQDSLSAEDLRQGLHTALAKLGPKRKVLAVPPDFTRFHSRAGELTRYAWEFYGERLTDVLPAALATPAAAAESNAVDAWIRPGQPKTMAPCSMADPL